MVRNLAAHAEKDSCSAITSSVSITGGLMPWARMDGMRCDIEGNLYVTRHGKGTVAKVSPDGAVLLEIELTGKLCSNLAFGGPDGRTCYVTLADWGNIEVFRTDLPGRSFSLFNK
jgi:sugar lactone lactonase YvrE